MLQAGLPMVEQILDQSYTAVYLSSKTKLDYYLSPTNITIRVRIGKSFDTCASRQIMQQSHCTKVPGAGVSVLARYPGPATIFAM
jgi:hypothetical protein